MLFQTRKELKRRIENLKLDLEHERQVNALIEKSGLKKCEGIMCKACVHSVFILDGWDNPRIIGCDLQTNCPHFKQRTSQQSSPNALQETLFSSL